MNIIKRSTIEYYQSKYPLAKVALDDWYDQFSRKKFKSHQELKEMYGHASIVANSRVVFNIKGTSYRLVVMVRYDIDFAYIIWFGTHEEYNGINVDAVGFDQKILEKK
jgi:mRNA interferase HigB